MPNLFETRLIRVLDFEGTAKEPGDAEVIEIGYVDFDRDTFEISEGKTWLCGAKSNPPESRAIHHIWPEDIADLPPFDAARLIADTQAAGVLCLAAHNSQYEGALLGPLPDGLPLICTYKAALRTWPDAPSHSNFGLLYWLMDQGRIHPDRNRLRESHRALPDSYATAHILRCLYEDGVTGAELMRWTREPRLLPKCPIGTWRDHPWADVDDGFLRWICSKIDMDEDIQWNAQREINRRNEQ